MVIPPAPSHRLSWPGWGLGVWRCALGQAPHDPVVEVPARPMVVDALNEACLDRVGCGDHKLRTGAWCVGRAFVCRRNCSCCLVSAIRGHCAGHFAAGPSFGFQSTNLVVHGIPVCRGPVSLSLSSVLRCLRFRFRLRPSLRLRLRHRLCLLLCLCLVLCLCLRLSLSVGLWCLSGRPPTIQLAVVC